MKHMDLVEHHRGGGHESKTFRYVDAEGGPGGGRFSKDTICFHGPVISQDPMSSRTNPSAPALPRSMANRLVTSSLDRSPVPTGGPGPWISRAFVWTSSRGSPTTYSPTCCNTTRSRTRSRCGRPAKSGSSALAGLPGRSRGDESAETCLVWADSGALRKDTPYHT